MNQPINQSINQSIKKYQSTLFKKEGKHMTAEAVKPVALQLN